MKGLNLCEILKGHEGEIFYSVALGHVKLYKVYKTTLVILALKHNSIGFEVNAVDIIKDLFPSNDQRDWNKWVEEQNPKVPKTWSELIKNNKYKDCEAGVDKNGVEYAVTPIEKSALALLKIHQLIEVGYGGNVTDKEWKDTTKLKWYFIPSINGTFVVVCSQNYVKKRHIAFHTKEQAEEFLSYPENVQLLKDYFMI